MRLTSITPPCALTVGGMTDALIPLFRSRDQSHQTRIRESEELVQIRRGVYARRDQWDELDPWDRYRHRVLAFSSLSPDAVFSHESAAILHGLPLFGEPKDIHLYARDRGSSSRTGDVMTHASASQRSLTRIGTLTATSLIDTAVDLGRVLPPASALAVWDAVARRGVTTDELREAWVGQASSRGTRTLLWLGSEADGRAESPGESVSRAAIAWLGFPRPVVQMSVGSDRPDFAWPEYRVLGEFDGFTKYSWEGRDPREALRAEKMREDRLRRESSGFARWTLADVFHPERLRDILRAAGLREVEPPDALMLSTLERTLSHRRLL